MDPASARRQTKLLRRGFKKQGESKVASGPVDMVYVMKSMTKINLTLNHIYVRLDHFFTEDHLAPLEKNDLVMSSQMIGIVTLINALTETPSPKNIPATKQAAFDKKLVEFHSIFSRLLKSGYFLFERNQMLQTSLKESGNNLLDWSNSKYTLDNAKAVEPRLEERSNHFKAVMSEDKYRGDKARIRDLESKGVLSPEEEDERLLRKGDIAEHETIAWYGKLQGSGRRFCWK